MSAWAEATYVINELKDAWDIVDIQKELNKRQNIYDTKSQDASGHWYPTDKGSSPDNFTNYSFWMVTEGSDS